MHNRVALGVLLTTLVASTACGGSPPAATPAATTPTGSEHHAEGAHHDEGEHHAKGEHGEHHGLSAPARAFHDALGPLWHMEKGTDRTEKTCAGAPALREKASATGNEPLVAATTSLVSECGKAGRPEFDARFAEVHERFHALAEQ